MTRDQFITCTYCHFWERTKIAGRAPAPYGICRLNPPVVLSNGESIWPTLYFNDWCGKYTPNIAAIEEERATRINENGEEK